MSPGCADHSCRAANTSRSIRWWSSPNWERQNKKYPARNAITINIFVKPFPGYYIDGRLKLLMFFPVLSLSAITSLSGFILALCSYRGRKIHGWANFLSHLGIGVNGSVMGLFWKLSLGKVGWWCVMRRHFHRPPLPDLLAASHDGYSLLNCSVSSWD